MTKVSCMLVLFACGLGAADYNSMALADLKSARATDHPERLKDAARAVAEALRTTPGNFETLKIEVQLKLAEGLFEEALKEAKALNAQVPDDNQIYGWIADAEIALGDYAEAEKATQWMIDQRPVNALGLQRGARLREIFGYNDAALDWWNSALRITSSVDTEERAWILTQMSRVALRMGKPADAEKDARRAMELATDYPWAEDALAAAWMAQGKAAEAAELLQHRVAGAPNTRARYYLASAWEAAGKSEQAAAEWCRFAAETGAIPERIEYYATHGRAADAVKLGKAATQGHSDIETLAAYAAALSAVGNYNEARIQMERALAPGIRDAKLFCRAGVIAAQLKDKAAASRYFRKAIEMNAGAPEADTAMQMLAKLSD